MAGAADDEVVLDVAELRSLLGIATRPRVKEMLEVQVRNLEASRSSQGDGAVEMEVSDPGPAPVLAAGGAADVGGVDGGAAVRGAGTSSASSAAGGPSGGSGVSASQAGAGSSAASAVPPTAAPVLLQTERAPVQRSYSPVSSFSWDQDSEKVKIYFFLEGASKEGVELDAREHSVDVRMHDVGAAGRHLRFGAPQLHGSIEPARCSVVVKPSRVTVILGKRDRGHWPDLNRKEDKLKPKAAEASKDPMAGIMDLMKNMYEEGDEDMKRTIAKAWTEAQSGKMKDPMMATF